MKLKILLVIGAIFLTAFLINRGFDDEGSSNSLFSSSSIDSLLGGDSGSGDSGDDSVGDDSSSPYINPEPATIALLGSGLLGYGLLRRRRKK